MTIFIITLVVIANVLGSAMAYPQAANFCVRATRKVCRPCGPASASR